MHGMDSLSYGFCGADFLPFLIEKSLNLAAAMPILCVAYVGDLRREMCAVHMFQGRNVQIEHENSVKATQKGSGRHRSRAEKVGRLKYIIELLKRLKRQIGEIDVRTRTLMAGLRYWISFGPSYIQKVACEDEVDVEIITCLIQKGMGVYCPRPSPQSFLKAD
jgi:hypothetical protein